MHSYVVHKMLEENSSMLDKMSNNYTYKMLACKKKADGHYVGNTPMRIMSLFPGAFPSYILMRQHARPLISTGIRVTCHRRPNLNWNMRPSSESIYIQGMKMTTLAEEWNNFFFLIEILFNYWVLPCSRLCAYWAGRAHKLHVSLAIGWLPLIKPHQERERI